MLPDHEGRISAVRSFNRFYTRQLGVLGQRLLESPFSLSEARVLYELAHHDGVAAKAIGTELDLDPGYLSRIVQKFADDGLVSRKPLPEDRRQQQLNLTPKGRQAFARLDRSSHEEVAKTLRRMSEADQRRLTAAMTAIEGLLDRAHAPAPILREPRPGDMGWVVHSHGECYASEYGWDSSFEALVAEIAAQFLRSFDASRERCWIAELDGAPVGSIFLVRHDDDVAKLRLLLVEPAGRGHSLGKRLVGECISFARACGYRKITLWTQSILTAARTIYREAGFVLVATEPHRSFGQSLIGETWEMKL